MARLVFVRLLPVVLLVVAAGFWFHDVQEGGPWVFRNLLPPLCVLVLSIETLRRGRGSWTAAGWQWPLGTLGFALPALGLAAYLHYAWSVRLDELFADAAGPGQLFRYLPVYTMVAGGIGFGIGWTVGRKL